MDLIEMVFVPYRSRSWQYFAGEVGGIFEEGNLWHGESVSSISDGVPVVLEAERHAGLLPATVFRAPLPGPIRLRLRLSTADMDATGSLYQALGGHDAQIGVPYFDRKFFLRTNNTEQTRLLFEDAWLRSELTHLSRVMVEIRSPRLPSFLSGDSKDYGELRLYKAGKIDDLNQLQKLYDLFVALAQRLPLLLPQPPKAPFMSSVGRNDNRYAE